MLPFFQLSGKLSITLEPFKECNQFGCFNVSFSVGAGQAGNLDVFSLEKSIVLLIFCFCSSLRSIREVQHSLLVPGVPVSSRTTVLLG